MEKKNILACRTYRRKAFLFRTSIHAKIVIILVFIDSKHVCVLYNMPTCCVYWYLKMICRYCTGIKITSVPSMFSFLCTVHTVLGIYPWNPICPQNVRIYLTFSTTFLEDIYFFGCVWENECQETRCLGKEGEKKPPISWLLEQLWILFFHNVHSTFRWLV